MNTPITNEMPSAAGSANRQPPMSPAPDGGGVLPYGGNNFPAPNKFAATTGQSFFADGGVVPDVPQEGVPDTSTDQQPQGGSPMPDPRKAMAYLTGDGAIAPDIVDALGRSVDPDGTMDAGERFTKTLMQAPSPDAAWGIMQHGRTRFNAYSAAAKVAMDKGDMGRAAMYATQAFDHVPTGQSVKFAPGRGGVTMLTKPHGGAQPASNSKAFGMGGTVDASNPDNSAEDDSGEDPSFADGGVVGDEPMVSEDLQDRNIVDPYQGGGLLEVIKGGLGYGRAQNGMPDKFDNRAPTHAERNPLHPMGNAPTISDSRRSPTSFSSTVSAGKAGGAEDEPQEWGSSLPYSENIEDRRAEHGEGWAGKDNGPTLEGIGEGYTNNARMMRQEQDQQGVARNSGVVRKQRAFADGGEVDGEEGVIPTEVPEDTTAPEADQPADTTTTGATPTPAQLNRQQLIALLDAGYDKIIEGAMEQPAPEGTPDDVTGAVTPEFNPSDPMAGPPQKDPRTNPLGGVVDTVKNWWNSAPNPAMNEPESGPVTRGVVDTVKGMFKEPTGRERENVASPDDILGYPIAAAKKVGQVAADVGRAAVDARNWPTAPMGPGWSRPEPKAPAGPSAGVIGPTPGAPEGRSGTGGPTRVNPLDPMGEPPTADAPTGPVADPTMYRQPQKDPQLTAPNWDTPQQKWERQYNTLLQQAQRIWPNASQEAQRVAYITGQMQGDQSHRQKMELEQTKEGAKAQEGQAKRTSAEGIAHDRIASSELRSRANLMSRERVVAAQQMVKMFEGSHNRELSMIKARLGNNPDFENTPEFKSAVAAISKAANKPPDAVMDMLSVLQGSTQAPRQTQPQPQGGAAPDGPVRIKKTADGRQFKIFSDGSGEEIKGAGH